MGARIALIIIGAAGLSGCMEFAELLGPKPGSSPVFSFDNHQDNTGNPAGNVNANSNGNTNANANGNTNANANDNTAGNTNDNTNTNGNANGNDNTTDNGNANANDNASPIFGGIGDIPPLEGDVITTDSGLQYIDIEVGAGDQPLPSSTVTVDYTGWLTDGTQFDSNDGTQFSLGGVIAGWTEGVGSMRVGGQRRLLIPPDLAYGEAGRPPTIPANATLVFDITLLDIQN
jgi:FKBP-type peptidyl-prolyl cis-trans isomerase FkpA